MAFMYSSPHARSGAIPPHVMMSEHRYGRAGTHLDDPTTLSRRQSVTGSGQ